jgi:hypothetical protein
MFLMLKRLATALVAATVGATALMAAAPAMADATPTPTPTPAPVTPAPAPAGIVSIKVTPDPVVIKGRDSVAVTASVKTVDAKDVVIDFSPAGGSHWGGDRAEFNAFSGAHKWDDWSRTISLSQRDADGTWAVTVTATGLDGKSVTARSFFQVEHVKWNPPPRPHGPRWTRLGFDASPEPVKKNHKVSLDGKLAVANCYDGWYTNGIVVVFNADRCDSVDRWHNWRQLGWKEISIYFQKKGHGRWEFVDTITTDPDGTFHAEIPAYWSGTWKVVFKGSRGLHGSSATDYVRVVR